ncbi:hypothetical protein BJ878DRAFT_414150 [Calycina marina]|uniref:Glycosyl hydrolase n=1 Tax=Calycina marina TaxID=1763456 RepID=A0A9P8CIC4_9HELO|nr:hypothetical protein BJ878DRAFT_414150 [Calycina marina]
MLASFIDALDVLQQDYYEIWQGLWPTSIDWTSAIIGTYIAAALSTLSEYSEGLNNADYIENLIDKYFSQLVGGYFGQDVFALRQEAYDDMLWVVLEYLEALKFIFAHSTSQYKSSGGQFLWHGAQYIPAFAHRARIFWDLASAGWDTKLCDGGMIWSPYLEPYKNAITNELYISASISMYLYFPGDENASPFGFDTLSSGYPPASPRDPKYLAAAVEGYKWLTASNMTDYLGLYVDGYHVSNWSNNLPPNSTKPLRCDARNEMVYTYNQGVILSGQRGLYESTGAFSYIHDGHQLVQNVIAATGWNLATNTASQDMESKLYKWRGLGRDGVLEDACDSSGDCSQDGQTFKGIFFHHLTLFCVDLPDVLAAPDTPAHQDNVKSHAGACGRYKAWIRHNAVAALETKNSVGIFGMWWGAPSVITTASEDDTNITSEIPSSAVDYRNQGVPKNWALNGKRSIRAEDGIISQGEIGAQDLNDRNRGRTVETQGGGLSVLRAAWELADKGLK